MNDGEKTLKILLSSNIVTIKKKSSNGLIVYYNNGYELNIDNKEDLYRREFQDLKKQIDSFRTKRINRERNKNIGKLIGKISAGVLALTVTYTGFNGIIDGIKESNEPKDDLDNNPSISATEEIVKPEIVVDGNTYVIEENIVSNDTIEEQEEIIEVAVNEEEVKDANSLNVSYISMEFDDITENGKLEQTIELCSPYLDKYIERYNLPRDLTYAMVTQEREAGNLDFSVNDSGACGPMQLQVGAHHNDDAIEFMKVPVYENGVFTGTYDEFYVADARKLDDPRLVGKKYLVMQDLKDHFQIGAAKMCLANQKYQTLELVAIDSHNKGLYAFTSCVSKEEMEYYKSNVNDLSWMEKIKDKYGENYGDKDYLFNVFRYLKTGNDGVAEIKWSYIKDGEQFNNVLYLTNERVYNNTYSRG